MGLTVADGNEDFFFIQQPVKFYTKNEIDCIFWALKNNFSVVQAYNPVFLFRL
jgi:hypothetical protein